MLRRGGLAFVTTIACGDAPATTTGSTTTGIVIPDHTADASTSETSSSSSETGSDASSVEPLLCTDHADCHPGLQCLEGICTGCAGQDDCHEDERCIESQCIRAQDAPFCSMENTPSCGNGAIEALEECEGGPACDDCVDASAPTHWFDADQSRRAVVLSDGSVLGLGVYDLTRFGPDGEPVWSRPTAASPSTGVVDEEGTLYVVGSRSLDGTVGVGWLGAWDDVGEERWFAEYNELGSFTGIAGDEAGLVVTGTVEQTNSPRQRGFVARYGRDGVLEWSAKLAAYKGVYSPVLHRDHTIVTAPMLGDSSTVRLIQLDGEGKVRWEATPEENATGVFEIRGMFGDGRGGVWIHGAYEDGPWLARFDEDGRNIAHHECLGATSGSIRGAVLRDDGRLALGMWIDNDMMGFDAPFGWLAFFEGGSLTGGVRLPEAALRFTALHPVDADHFAVAVEEGDVVHLWEVEW